MRRKKTDSLGAERVMVRTILVLAVFAVVAVPLLPALTPLSTDTFLKASVFQSIVEMMVALWLPLAVACPKYRPRLNMLTAGVLAFTAAAALSLAFVPDASLSFWSKPTRMSGVLTLLHFTAWFLVLSSTLRESGRRAIAAASLITCAILSAVALLQAPGTEAGARATFGNQLFLASYILPHFLLLAYLWRDATSRRSRMLLAAAVPLMAGGLLVTSSRGALLSLTILAFGSALAWALRVKGPRGRRAGIVLAIALLAAATGFGLYALRAKAPEMAAAGMPMPDFVQRFAKKDFGSDRIALWGFALRGVSERPAFGWGNDQFSSLYGRFFDAEGKEGEIFFERWQDRAHNQYLDTLVSYGAVGLAAYLFMWLALWREALRRRRHGTVAAVAALSFFLLFMFDTPAMQMAVYTAFALLAARREKRDADCTRRISPAPLLLSLPLALAAVWLLNAGPAAHIRRFEEAGKPRAVGGQADAELYRETLDGMAGYRDDYRLNLLFAVQPYADHAGVRTDGMRKLVELAYDETLELAEGRPYDYRALMAHATAARMLSAYEPDAAAEALRFAERAVETAPGMFDARFELAECLLAAGRPEEAERSFVRSSEQAYSKLAGFREMVVYRMAQTYAQRRDFVTALKMVELGTSGPHAFRADADARLLLELGDAVRPGDGATLDDFAPYVDRVLANWPVHPTLHAAAARFHAARGDKNRAARIVGGLVGVDRDLAWELVHELDLPYSE